MKWLKYALYTLLGLVVLVLAGVALIAATFDPNAYKAEIEKRVKAATGRTLKFHGDIELAFWPAIGARVGKVTLSRRASEHDFAAVESARVAVAVLPLLRGQVQVDEVSLTGVKASVVRAKGGKFDFEDLMGAAGAPAQPGSAKGATPGKVKFDIAGIQLKDSSFAYLDEGSGQRLELDDVQLRTGRIADDVPGKLSLAAHVRGKKPLVDLKVTLEGTYRLALESQAYALTGMTLGVNGAAAEMTRIALTVTGDARAQLAKEAVEADLLVKFDDTTVTAKLGMSGFSAPHYRLQADVDRIDLDRYLVAQKDAKPAPSAGPKVAVDVPVDLSALEGLRADGRLAVGWMQLMGMKVSDLKAELRVANGRAEVAPHSAKLYEGTLQGALTLAAKGNRIAVKETLSGVAIGPLVKDLMGRDAVEGRGDVRVDIAAAGPTVAALKKSLDGTARIQMRDGALKGINLTEVLRKTRAAFGSKAAQQQPADLGQRTDFSALSASFVIKNGVARNDDLDVRAPLVRLGGAGDVDIGNSQLDYLAKATVVATSKGQSGTDLEHLSGLTIPVKLSGPFDAPRYEIDYRALAGDAAKAKVKEKAKEKVEQKLRDLFKR
ncbi:MAG: AsmA family protein [Betaproteobacteria bacterium]|nr:AsmA family protein [Betaproteobacteria bacterium]MDH4324702.1 AsmA family protein [Betaproteobacteria bacterium]MDH5212197.1 AsmA family protein [Betaproteobacteria bacterium]MDH5579547.1 AsmA family protein [Betaproteobacteria bacterium]